MKYQFVDKTKYPEQSNLEPTRISQESYTTACLGDKMARNANQCYTEKTSPNYMYKQ